MLIEIEFQLEPRELAKGAYAAFRRRYWWPRTLAVVTFLVPLYYVVAGILEPPMDRISVAIWTLGFVYFFAVECLRLPLLVRKCRRAGTAREVVTLSETGYSAHEVTRDGEHRSNLEWRAFERIEQTPVYFLLFLNRKRVVVLPKRAFGPDDVALFSRFVEDGFSQARTSHPVDVA